MSVYFDGLIEKNTTNSVEMKFTLRPDTQRMCTRVGGAIRFSVIGVLPPKLQLVVLAR